MPEGKIIRKRLLFRKFREAFYFVKVFVIDF